MQTNMQTNMQTYTQDLEQFRALATKHDTCMLVTFGPGDDPRARPMALADVSPDGKLIFATSTKGRPAEEVSHDRRVIATFQASMSYLAVTGTAAVRTDPGLITRYWKETWRAWFPDGPSDPHIALLEVTPHEVDSWDTTGTNGIKMLFNVVKAAVAGEEVKTPHGVHETLHL